MSYSINDSGLLQGDDVSHQIVTKDSGFFSSGQLKALIMHYTGGSTLEGAVSHLANPNVSASAHLVIGDDGRIVQMVPFNKKAWHAGVSRYQNLSGLNKYSIGIEVVNAGPLKAVGDQFISDFGKVYPANRVLQAVHRNESSVTAWQTYSEEQLRVVYQLSQLLINHYQLELMLGHEEIAPQRKRDPGPAFPLDHFRAQLFDSRAVDEALPNEPVVAEVTPKPSSSTDTGRVSASRLNIRQQPSLAAERVRDPLPFGTEVRVVKQAGDWCMVEVPQTGWVKTQYLDLS